jgi:nitrate/TMAO reductase-like tetraheme cytochrome c subunit
MTDDNSSATSPAEARSKRPVLALFTSHWLAMVGFALVLTGIVLWLFLLTVHLRHGADNPYIGVAVVIAGGVLALGAALTPIGLWFGRRRMRQQLATIDRKAAWGRLLLFFVVTAAINVAILSQSATLAVHHLESNQFCTSCHVHLPEQRAFGQGPHAGVTCVDCHVGDGTLGFVQSKLQGTQQLWSMITNTVHMPVETAIERDRMVPSAQTCEDCHWKEMPVKATVKFIQRYADDEANTPKTTLLTMNVGGRPTGGIHGAHHGEGVEIRFVATNRSRQDIPLVEYTNSITNESRTYVKAGTDALSLAGKPRIAMQCFDCHNRPAHAFQMPDRAVDQAIMIGRISASLPFLKKTAVEILKAPYATSAEAAEKIPAALTAYYQTKHPDAARTRADDIAAAGATLADIYAHNVFPEFRVGWGTYPDNRGHQDFPGCFRCHDGEHATPTGEKITNNCFRCHFPAAVGDTNPEVLKLLGVDRLLRNLQKK